MVCITHVLTTIIISGIHFSSSSSKNKLCFTKEGDDENNAHTQSRGSFGKNKDHTVNGESNVCDRIPDQKVVDPLGAYKDAAPELLGELESLLSRYQWSEEGCIPRGVVNILNCSSQDLTAVVLESGKSPFQGADCAKHTLNLKSHIPVADRNTPKELIVESVRKLKKKKSSPKPPFERKVKPRPDLPTRAFSPDAHKDRGRQRSRHSTASSSIRYIYFTQVTKHALGIR